MSFDPNDVVKYVQRLGDIYTDVSKNHNGPGKRELARIGDIFQSLSEALEKMQNGAQPGLRELFLIADYARTLQKVTEMSKKDPNLKAVMDHINQEVSQQGQEILEMFPKIIEELLRDFGGGFGGGFPDLGDIFNNKKDPQPPRKPQGGQNKMPQPPAKGGAKKPRKPGDDKGGNFKL